MDEVHPALIILIVIFLVIAIASFQSITNFVLARTYQRVDLPQSQRINPFRNPYECGLSTDYISDNSNDCNYNNM